MNTTAFVSATPVVARAAGSVATSSFSPRQATPSVTVAVPRRARVVMVDDENKSIPQGFTLFSEQLNGRAAMMGFVVAIVTEVITGEGIIGQLNSAVKVVENVLPF